jgi:multicomponent Na+:H+ antiporter subunit G
VDTVGDVLMVLGAGWSALAAVGVNRFGDVFARMHAATKSTTLGLLLVLFGAALHLPVPEAVKLLLAAVLLLPTAPIGAHLVGRAVHRNIGAAEVRIDTVDELRDEGDGPTP